MTTETTAKAEDFWTNCDLCDRPAEFFSLHEGCSLCGGGDCGDSPCVSFYCHVHAAFLGIAESVYLLSIPLVVDPVEYSYALLGRELGQADQI